MDAHREPCRRRTLRRSPGSPAKRRALAALAVAAWSPLAVVACGSSGEPPGDHDITAVAPSTPSPVPGTLGTQPDAARGTAGGDAANADDGGGVEAPPTAYVDFDVNHVLSTGQSNAVANDGKPILTTTQPYGNLMFDTGVITAEGCDGNGCTSYPAPSAFSPLVEGDHFFGYPVETMSSALANEITRRGLARAFPSGWSKKRHDILVSIHGRSGNPYWCLRKGGCDWWPTMSYLRPFDEAMLQVSSANALAQAAGKTYVVRAVTAVHGEADHYAYSGGNPLFPLPRTDGKGMLADYADALEEWQRDYEEGVRAITGQSIGVPLFINQYSHWNDVPTTKIAYQQLAAHVRSKGKVVIVGPTYVLPYSEGCLHFTGPGERWLGEYFAKVYARVVLEGRPWEPLRPIAVSQAGNVVTVKLHVPKPPIVFDTAKVTNPGNYGFEVHDDSGATPTITSVAITAADTVTIALSGPLTGPNKRVRYAYTFTGCAGSGTIARGNVHDSDDAPSPSGNDLSNWLVHFDEPLP